MLRIEKYIFKNEEVQNLCQKKKKSILISIFK